MNGILINRYGSIWAVISTKRLKEKEIKDQRRLKNLSEEKKSGIIFIC